ncbi:hypothetical protein RJ639_038387 [Escallonia herrerae]|uniref:non-specific serine/threonine protein kinase n=1 Tax=Escallonia herrerae TaxID=1293975 RepID=A0AA88WNU7_9ASTE|nr:hypothetical protein RJ639_038387 [Escallonia herrerae]
MYRKISKAEFKFPNWFLPGVRRLISRILDPNPKTRISIAKIMDNSWFRKGLGLNAVRSDIKENDLATIDTDAVSVQVRIAVHQRNQNNPSNLNAFEIISLSAGFDLFGLFKANDQEKEGLWALVRGECTLTAAYLSYDEL